MRVLLTGGRGLVGLHLARRLRSHHEVIATDLPKPGDPPGEELDVTDGAAVHRAFSEHRPDYVVHLAAWTEVDACERDPARAMSANGEGTRNVAAACRALGAPLLYVSTDYVFDGTKSGPYVESDPVNPLSAYGRSKLAGEEAVRETVDAWTIVRSQSLYGEGRVAFVDKVIRRAAAGDEVKVVTDQRISPTWAEHHTEGLARLISGGSRGLFHLANSGSCTWYEFARAALDLAGLPATPITPATAAGLGLPARRPANSAFSCARYEIETGRQMPPWRVGLQTYLATRVAQRGAS